jgi:hypothetical protein
MRLVVGGAAAVEVAILFDQHERIASPVRALRLHDIEVCEQQYRLGLGVRPIQSRDQPALLGMIGDAEQPDILPP